MMFFSQRVFRKTLFITVMALALLVVSIVVLVSCSKRISGTRTTNQPPVVNFVNVPPDSLKVSKNTVVYWFGSDPDGLVKEYRYVVARKSDMLQALGGGVSDSALPIRYANEVLPNIDLRKWTRIFVTKDDPKTHDTVRLGADLEAPVSHYVTQYIFLVAVDDQGTQSQPVWKILSRNDNPPNTFIRITGSPDGSQKVPFLNSALKGGALTGVRVTWAGESPNYTNQADAPPFAVRWKMFGPYDSLSLSNLRRTYVKKVFVTTNGEVHVIGNGDTLHYCDTTYPGGVMKVDCKIMLVDTVTKKNDRGTVDDKLLVYSPAFVADTAYYKLIDSSSSDDKTGWVAAGPSTFYNVYAKSPSDTTREMQFILWATCRDDAYLEDPVPAFRTIYVLDPRMEKDVLVIDCSYPVVSFQATGRINGPIIPRTIIDPNDPDGNSLPLDDSGRVYWTRAIRSWRPNITFDSLADYRYLTSLNAEKALQLFVRYKILILYNDDVKTAGITGGSAPTDKGAAVYNAIDAGVNAWLIMRAPIVGDLGTGFYPAGFPIAMIDDQYRRYWGVSTIVNSGWAAWAVGNPNAVRVTGKGRVEDFVGASTLNPSKLPDLAVDTSQLHRRYYWGFGIQGDGYDRDLSWRADLACLPEVNWTKRIAGTEPLYLYKSKYGAEPIPHLNVSFEGAPVAHRFPTSLYRTAHFNFTPLSISDAQMQIVTDTILNWLYEGQSRTSGVDRYPDAVIKLSPDQVWQNFEYRQSTRRSWGN